MGNFVSALVSRHRTLMNVFDKAPVVDKDAFVAPSASVIGDVQIGRGSSIWYGCVLRGKVCLTRSFHTLCHSFNFLFIIRNGFNLKYCLSLPFLEL